MRVPNTLAEVLGLDRPVFIGSSIGGNIALDLARYYPDRYRAVIAVEAALSFPVSEPGQEHAVRDWLAHNRPHQVLALSVRKDGFIQENVLNSLSNEPRRTSAP